MIIVIEEEEGDDVKIAKNILIILLIFSIKKVMKKSNSHRKGQIMLKGIMLSKKMDRGKEMVEEDKKNRNKFTNDIKNKKTIKNQSELFIRRGEIDKDNKKEALI